MTHQLERLIKAHDHTVVGVNFNGIKIMQEMVFIHPDGDISLFTYRDRFKFKYLFTRPTFQQRQDDWLQECLAIARGKK